MDLIWYGTASIAVTSNQGKILFDPFVPLKKSSVEVQIEEYDDFSDVFVTHCHLDHVRSLPAIVKQNPGVKIHCTETPYKTLLKKGISKYNLDLLHYGDVLNIKGFEIHIFHGKHAILPGLSLKTLKSWFASPARGNLPLLLRENFIYKENDETVFYQIEAEGKSISLMGSMNLREDVEYPVGSDVLVLPYNGWKDNLSPAVRVIERLQPKKILLDHYDDTFPPVSSLVDVVPIIQKYKGCAAAMRLRDPVDV